MATIEVRLDESGKPAAYAPFKPVCGKHSPDYSELLAWDGTAWRYLGNSPSVSCERLETKNEPTGGIDYDAYVQILDQLAKNVSESEQPAQNYLLIMQCRLLMDIAHSLRNIQRTQAENDKRKKVFGD